MSSTRLRSSTPAPTRASSWEAPPQLNGSVTDDGRPAPGALTVSWSAVSGPGLVTFADSTQPRTQARFGAPGTYLLRLTASDGALSSFDDVQVVVNAANLAPVVSAGPDLTIALPATTATLDGSVVDDGRLLASPALAWTQIGGPQGVVFVQPSSATTAVTLPGVGSFDLRLTAFDGQLTSSDDVRVTVVPEPPPSVDAQDGSVPEGDEGLTGASVEVRLSKPWAAPVSVDYVTRTAPPPTPATTGGASAPSSSPPGKPLAPCSSPSRATTPRRATRSWKSCSATPWKRHSAATGRS